MLNIVLYQPEIPGNTGNIGRTCVALGATLWLVKPLGFDVDQKALRRAGLDYWQHLDWHVAENWDDLLERLQPERIWYFTRFATNSYDSVQYRPNDALVFGRETAGLPESLTVQNPENNLRIRTTGKVRSLNLASAAAVVAYEATRQLAAQGFVNFE